MHPRTTLKLLEKYNLIDSAKSHSHIFKRVLTECLNAKKEEVLIVGDEGYEGRRIAALMATSYYVAARELGLNANLIIQKPKTKGDDADENIIDSLENLKEGNIIILNLSNRLGSIKDLGKSYRKFVKSHGHRFVSTPKIGRLTNDRFSLVANSINIDYKALQERSEQIKQILDDGKELHVTSPKGTDFYMNIKSKKAVKNDGDYKKPATGGNIPAGEVYIPPYGKKYVSGKMVIDASSSHKEGSTLVKHPITLIVEKGKVVEIDGDKEADALKLTLDWAEAKAKHPWGIRRVGEFGIGLNPNARIVGATIIDEKVLGTAHFALGSNYWFGGTIYAIIHLDQIFRNPSIYVDGEKLVV
ncbi:aminopeptidase [Candidatus Woesearchaeota archaeon]|nr:aminopeptidase [Candidatus Woesearchaeota archaeon]